MKIVLYAICAAVIIYCGHLVDERANRTEAYARTCALHATRK